MPSLGSSLCQAVFLCPASLLTSAVGIPGMPPACSAAAQAALLALPWPLARAIALLRQAPQGSGGAAAGFASYGALLRSASSTIRPMGQSYAVPSARPIGTFSPPIGGNPLAQPLSTTVPQYTKPYVPRHYRFFDRTVTPDPVTQLYYTPDNRPVRLDIRGPLSQRDGGRCAADHPADRRAWWFHAGRRDEPRPAAQAGSAAGTSRTDPR